MTAREVVRRIEDLGGRHVRTKGSHATYEVVRRTERGGLVARARAQVPVHTGDVPPGTLRAIQRQLVAVPGEGWLVQ